MLVTEVVTKCMESNVATHGLSTHARKAILHKQTRMAVQNSMSTLLCSAISLQQRNGNPKIGDNIDVIYHLGLG